MCHGRPLFVRKGPLIDAAVEQASGADVGEPLLQGRYPVGDGVTLFEHLNTGEGMG